MGLWLVFVVLYDVALLGALMAGGDGIFASHVFPWLVLANPADAFRLYNLVLLDSAPVAGIDGLARDSAGSACHRADHRLPSGSSPRSPPASP